MLINYSCTNYKSYRYKNAFSFSASKIKQFDEDNINCENCGALGALEIVKRGGLS